MAKMGFLAVALFLLASCKGKLGSSAAASASAAVLDPQTAAENGFKLFDGPKDEAGAVKLWEQSCAAHNELGCVGMGMTYALGLGDKLEDFTQAKALLEPGCDHGNQRACSVLGQILYNGWGTPKDIEQARKLWKAGCDVDLGRACYFLGITERASDGPPQWHDEEGGDRLLRRACNLNYKPACEDIETLQKSSEMDRLRQKITVRWWDFEKDAQCTGKGLPPYKKDYEGGTFDENEKVALADGCKSPFQSRDDSLRNTFCCPHDQKK